MIGEGYGYMKGLAEATLMAQVAIASARLEGMTQKGDIEGAEDSLTIVFE
jgi:hypothetical protein